jgi:enamine deaminase RidA (YjgF/YER057c/UK114 family)
MKMMMCAALIAAMGGAVQAQSGVPVKHLQTATAAIASAVWAGDTLYVSGQLATPVTPADREKGTPAVYGDTKAQTQSALQKIETILKEQGLGMSDVVMMHVFLVGDPAKENKLDFQGMMASYTTFFGTKDQPNKPARSAMQVAALAAAGALVEIEVIAVRGKG